MKRLRKKVSSLMRTIVCNNPKIRRCSRPVETQTSAISIAGEFIKARVHLSPCSTCLDKNLTAAREHRTTPRFKFLDNARKDRRGAEGRCSSCGRPSPRFEYDNSVSELTDVPRANMLLKSNLSDPSRDQTPGIEFNQEVCRRCLGQMAARR
jgi:hypothetical protein